VDVAAVAHVDADVAHATLLALAEREQIAGEKAAGVTGER
jgi:hypothetical protein